jgi:acylphosphatase
MHIIAKHLIIKGRVQGVFYRGWTVKTAQALGLAGWVRNLANGDVEMLVQGYSTDVARMIDLAWQGPATARVDDVAASSAEIGDLSGFEQR